MRILFITPSYKPAYTYGGPIFTISSLAESLAKVGNRVTVFTTTANGEFELPVTIGKIYLIDGVEVIYFSRKTKGHSNYSNDLLNKLRISIIKFDVVHIQSWWNLISIPAARICLMNDIQPIISPRGTLTDYTFTHSRVLVKRIIHYILGKHLLEKSTLLYSSFREQEEASKFIAPADCHVIPNLLKLPHKIYGHYKEEEFLKIIFLGRIDPTKNLELLLEVLGPDINVPFSLKIVGSGDEAYTNMLKEKSKHIPYVEWIGYSEGENKYKLLGEADILLLPSHTENFGNVVLEALSQGTPVLISNQVGAKDYVLKNKIGWVVLNQADDWKEAIQEIWINRNERKELRNRAFHCIQRDFIEKDQLKDYIQLYQNHINRFK